MPLIPPTVFSEGPVPWYCLSPAHPDPEQLMDPSPIGRRVRCGTRTGTITSQWVNGDDCSGGFGTLRFDLDHAHPNNNSCSVPAAECEFLD